MKRSRSRDPRNHANDDVSDTAAAVPAIEKAYLDVWAEKWVRGLLPVFAAVESVAMESVAVESVAVESVAVESVAVESVAVESVAVESVAVESVAVESVAVESVAIPTQ